MPCRSACATPARRRRRWLACACRLCHARALALPTPGSSIRRRTSRAHCEDWQGLAQLASRDFLLSFRLLPLRLPDFLLLFLCLALVVNHGCEIVPRAVAWVAIQVGKAGDPGWECARVVNLPDEGCKREGIGLLLICEDVMHAILLRSEEHT